MTMRRAGYAPLESAGEYVCECLRDGNRVFPKWGNEVCERIVRCRDCKRFSLDNSDHDYRSGWWCKRWDTDMVKPDGFCAWGERREDE